MTLANRANRGVNPTAELPTIEEKAEDQATGMENAKLAIKYSQKQSMEPQS